MISYSVCFITSVAQPLIDFKYIILYIYCTIGFSINFKDSAKSTTYRSLTAALPCKCYNISEVSGSRNMSFGVFVTTISRKYNCKVSFSFSTN